ncbi:MAG TPA: hypothetical protein VJM08_00320 [Anaerolineales bacterium]|nr:hypothetical protein [Anaerolineales bacterium]
MTFRKIVLETGDEYAIHSGAKGAVQMRAMQGTAVDDNISKEELMLSINDSSLTPWVAWLEKVDFERLWDGEV